MSPSPHRGATRPPADRSPSPNQPPRPPGELPSVAVLTMVRDEGSMLRRWVDHYAAQVGAEHVVVVDDSSSDGSTDDLPCPVLRFPPLHKQGFEPSRMGIATGLAAGMLVAYDAVIFCDADEFIVADPRVHPSLRHFVAARPDRAAVGVTCLNVVHDAPREPALRDGEPVLAQRRLAKFLPLMCKPSLKRVDARWVQATHGIQCPFEVDPELFMFHLKFADRGHLEAVADRRHRLNQEQGRAKGTSWERPGADLVDLLDDVTRDVDPTSVPWFRPSPQRLARIVRHEPPETWRATGMGQLEAMRKRPLVRIPPRFKDLL